MKVAVAMSVYKNDNPIYLKKAIKSILNQTYKNIHLYIEVDGVISPQLYQCLSSFISCSNISINFNSDCKGLAFRLNNIIDKVIFDGGYSYIARMDADDISRLDRIEKQVIFMQTHKDISVVGSDVLEIDEDDNFLFYKKMHCDHEIIVRDIIKKCPINHPSAFFKISSFYIVRYNSTLKNTQDYYLWIDFIYNNLKISNINEPLLKFRVNRDFYSRRGFDKAINDVKSRIYALRKLNCYSLRNIFHILMLFFLRVSPTVIKKIAYNRLR
ncbi:glycosyltransferase [Escherichia coli]|uniref:glycosyltransferase n=1 Tax=Escherichia coli TaxID=562 RepID=UPI000CFCADC9|nr:glycosyltransferase [Escherichia coli]